MGINLQTETLLTLSQAAAILPRDARGKRVHVASIRRWIRNGPPDRRLEALKMGRKWITSVEALQRFGNPPAESRQARVRRFPTSSRYRRSEDELDGRGC